MIQTHGHDIWLENCFDPKLFNLFIKKYTNRTEMFDSYKSYWEGKKNDWEEKMIWCREVWCMIALLW